MTAGNRDLTASISRNLGKIKSSVEKAASRSGRKSSEIGIMAVTKTWPLQYAEAAYKCGIRIFGENRINELTGKYSNFHDDADIHFIGHLQRNKAKTAVVHADFVDSIDKLNTAEALDRHCSLVNKKMNIYLEYNTSGESSKSGFTDETVFFHTADKIRLLENINIKGVMTIAPFTDDVKILRKSFRQLFRLYEKLRENHSDLDIDTVSMGMSSDFMTAIEEGSTLIRIGTSLFGSRH